MNPTCDVVITTRDRPEALRRCLCGLRQQSVDGFGIIVVDDCSDQPVEPGDHAVSLIRLDQRSGPAAGRNAGVAASRAEFVIFVDDDVVPSSHFVELHLAAVTAPGAAGTAVVSCGPFLQPADWDPTPWNLWEARGQSKEAENLMRGVYPVTWRQFHTGNNCLARSLFVEVGGFDETFKRAEDDELGFRLHKRGCTFHFEPGAIAWHYSRRSLESWLSIPRLYARYDVEIDRKHPDSGYLAAKVFELGQRRWPLRAARALLGGGSCRAQLGLRAAVWAALVLNKLGAVDVAMGAFSVAYDLSYVDSLRLHGVSRSMVVDRHTTATGTVPCGHVLSVEVHSGSRLRSTDHCLRRSFESEARA